MTAGPQLAWASGSDKRSRMRSWQQSCQTDKGLEVLTAFQAVINSSNPVGRIGNIVRPDWTSRGDTRVPGIRLNITVLWLQT